jgi:alpha-1,6-mannosyltransferase
MATTTEPSAIMIVTTERARPFPLRTIVLGSAGSLLMLVAALGAGAKLVHDPLLGRGPMSWVRYGHGLMLATALLYLGFGLVVWAWVKLGRHVLAGRVGTRAVLLAGAAWMAPLVISPPLFTRDVYSYIAQGTLPLYGLDPYVFGPISLNVENVVQNVHDFWVTTPAPYGPLFILVAKGVMWVTGTNMIVSVVLMRLVLMIGLGLLLWSLPGLVRHLGGSLPVTAWLVVAGPMTVVHLVGGPHNDLLMIGFMAAGTLCVLDRRHVLGVLLVTMAAAIKATAAIALPFLVWVWAGHLSSKPWRNFVRAVAGALAVFVLTFAVLTFAAGVDLGWLLSLGASSKIVNWLSLPTGIGELIHAGIGIFVDVNKSWVVNIVRAIGGLALLVFMVRQWWQARHGGPDAVRRAGIVLLAVAVLSPATLPWYLTWGFVLVAAIAWQRRHLAVVVGVAVFLVLTYSPAGEDQLYKPLYLLGALAISVLAGISLLHPDPLRLSTSPRPAGPSLLDVLKGAFRTVNVSKESFKAWLRDTR